MRSVASAACWPMKPAHYMVALGCLLNSIVVEGGFGFARMRMVFAYLPIKDMEHNHYVMIAYGTDFSVGVAAPYLPYLTLAQVAQKYIKRDHGML